VSAEGPAEETIRLDTVAEAIAEIRRGRLVLVVDDEDRENEGDLVGAAECASPEMINFMETHGRGLLCVPLMPDRLTALGIPVIDRPNRTRLHCTYAVPVDASDGVSTGISARDRACTIRKLTDPGAGPRDFVHGGHVQPLQAQPGGVLQRAGHTEATVDLARLAGLRPAAVLCEVKRADGEMMRLAQLRGFADQHGLKLISIADLIAWRQQRERLVRRVATVRMPTDQGEFTCVAYESILDGSPYVALVKGQIDPEQPTLVRMHSECLTGDALFSRRCDCGRQLAQALDRIEREGRGVLIYIRQEGRGIGLLNKLKAYELQDQGLDTVEANEHLGFPADLRDYGLGAQVLLDLGVRQMRLMTNNPRKIVALQGYGLQVVERVPTLTEVTADNLRYLDVKVRKLGHLLPLPLAPGQNAGGADDEEGTGHG
jgi:3,4-dihydroxy 2-butanone 4-phosphate synthase/GTP cyclohydrolase II